MNYKELADKIKATLEIKKSSGLSAPSTRSYAATSRTPQQLPAQIAPAKSVERKTNIVSKEWNSEVKHTSDYSFHLEAHPSPGADLIPTRVHRWNIKNYATIVRKMKSHIKIKEGEMTSKISVLNSSQEAQTVQAEKNHDDLWRDMMKSQEERQFRITRITNFFS